MTTAPIAAPRSPLLAFAREVYAPGLHLAYAAAWLLALEATLSHVAGQPWQPDGQSLVGIATLFLVLFYLRVADEWKDLAYDRVHNPGRPLVRGLVSLRDLQRYLAGAALLVVLLHLGTASAWPLLIALADMAWGLALVAVERRSAAVRDGMLLNLLVTYPVNVALSVYTYALWLSRSGGAPSWQGGAVLLAFALAFLVYELLRKIAWPALAKPGERLYSQALGPHGAIAAVAVCACGAAFLLFALLLQQGVSAPLAALATWPPLVPAAIALWRFLRERQRRLKLTGLGMGFLLLFYGALCLLALARLLLAQ